MELLKQAVLKETFPSWSGQESFSVVKVNYVISRVRIIALDFPETCASFVAGTGISVSVAQASATVSADWRIQAWLLKDQGELTMSISGLFIAVIFQVSRDCSDHLSTMLHSCQLIIDSVKAKFSGGSSWIYSFLSGYLEMSIHTKLDKRLCLNIKYKIQMMDAQLRKHKAPFALPNQGDSMVHLGVSNYFLKSASLAYNRAFNITISEELASTFNLNTSLLKYFVSEVAQSSSAAGTVLLGLVATSPPAATLNADTCVLQITAWVEVFAVLPNSTTQNIFAGNLQKSVVENFLSYALQGLVIPVINDKLGKGFPLLNLAHTSLAGPVIKMSQGHMVICTDVHYQLEDEEDLHSHS